MRRSLGGRDFGSRVAGMEEARALLDRVVEITKEVLKIQDVSVKPPQLVVTRRLSGLPMMTLKLYLIYIPLSIFLFSVTWMHPGSTGARWVVWTAIVLILLTPLLIQRRIRLNIEHSGRYTRDKRGQATIYIERLPVLQFQSYLAHEYAHHLYYELGGHLRKEWIREGWARLVQWLVVEALARSENNPAYLYHALVQVISELKFAAQIVSKSLKLKLPDELRHIPTLYHSNPLFQLLTGTPGYSFSSLTEHAVGTAAYFLAAHQRGLDEALHLAFLEEKAAKQKSAGAAG